MVLIALFAGAFGFVWYYGKECAERGGIAFYKPLACIKGERLSIWSAEPLEERKP